jgi:hypothetical protein
MLLEALACIEDHVGKVKHLPFKNDIVRDENIFSHYLKVKVLILNWFCHVLLNRYI